MALGGNARTQPALTLMVVSAGFRFCGNVSERLGDGESGGWRDVECAIAECLVFHFHGISSVRSAHVMDTR